MKKALVACLLCSLVAVANAAYKDGVYTGRGNGNHGAIDVEVTIKDSRIAQMRVVKHDDTPMLLKMAEKSIAKQIANKDNVAKIDAVTGASNSSKGIIEAVNNALKAASK